MKGAAAAALLAFLAAPAAEASSVRGRRLNASAAAAATSGAVRSRRVNATAAAAYEPPPPALYPDMSEDLGSITKDEAHATAKVVNYEPPKVTLDDVATDVSGFDCAQLTSHMEKLVRDTEKHRKMAFWKRIEGMKVNSAVAPPDGDWGNLVERTEAFERLDGDLTGLAKVNKALEESEHSNLLAKKLYVESLRVAEILGLKCGATDEYCHLTGTDLIKKFRDLAFQKEKSLGMMGEAGWIKAEASIFGATPEKKKAADLRSEEAWKKGHEVFDLDKHVSVGIMMKAAACAGKPPKGPWTDTADRCNLKALDPVMKALLKEDPVEFVKRWQTEIAKQIGVSPMYVKVDVSGCLKEGAMDYSTKTFSQQPTL